MLKIKDNYSLKNNNSFRLDVLAEKFVVINTTDQLFDIYQDKKLAKMRRCVIGEGSNLLFLKPFFAGLIIRVNIIGKKIIKENDEEIILEIGAGEKWHDLVTWSVKKDLGGIENLALIPGLVGAAPIQNIAAYGGNFSDVFVCLEAFDFKTGQLRIFNKKQCHFGYRDSIFKNKDKERFVVTKVTIKLKKNYQINTSYFMLGLSNDSLRSELEKLAKLPYRAKDVYNAVINIRKRKLPDVDKIPSVGSFFINPVVDKSKLLQLKRKVKNLQYYPVDQLSYSQLNDSKFDRSKYVKIAAGRLLDEMGMRGKQKGNVSVYKNHALVIVHNGKATGQEIFDFSQNIIKDFFKCYRIKLQTEVDIV